LLFSLLPFPTPQVSPFPHPWFSPLLVCALLSSLPNLKVRDSCTRNAKPYLQRFWIMINRNDQDHNFWFNAEVSKHITLWDRNMQANFLKYFQNCYWFFVCYLEREDISFTWKKGFLYYCQSSLASALGGGSVNKEPWVSGLDLALLDQSLVSRVH
jgi:hypothetical protein